MTTKPQADVGSVVTDGRDVLAQARKDSHDVAAFRDHLASHELDHFAASLDQLERAKGAASTTLHAQVAEGVHAARARAVGQHFLRLLRDDAKLAFPGDAAKQALFAVGNHPAPGSSTELETVLVGVRDAAERSPADARKVHLEGHGLHALEDMIDALQSTHDAHHAAQGERHDATNSLASLAHVVRAETAHVRLIAHRVFADAPDALARYKRTLPRHTVRHRAAPPAPPAAATS